MSEVLKSIGQALGQLRQEFKILTSEADFLAIDGGNAVTNFEEAVNIDGGNA